MAAILSGAPPGFMTHDELVIIARRSIDAARLPVERPDPRLLAAALGYEVRPADLPRGLVEFTDGRTIWYRPSHDGKEEALRVMHALAHCLLLREGEDHTECDAWRLTAALLEPDRASWSPAKRAPDMAPSWFWASWLAAISA